MSLPGLWFEHPFQHHHWVIPAAKFVGGWLILAFVRAVAWTIAGMLWGDRRNK